MSQAGEIDITGTHPEIPTEFIANVGTAISIANQLEILGEAVVAGSIPVETTASGNTVNVLVQTSQAIASTDATKIGLAAFDSADFSVDANGFVTIVASGLSWQVVTSASNPITLVKNVGYIVKGAGVVNFILPATSSVGDVFYIKGYGNLWTLAQNASQTITLGIAATTAGVTGSVQALQVQDTIELLCVTTNTEFDVLTSTGNLKFN